MALDFRIGGITMKGNDRWLPVRGGRCDVAALGAVVGCKRLNGLAYRERRELEGRVWSPYLLRCHPRQDGAAKNPWQTREDARSHPPQSARFILSLGWSRLRYCPCCHFHLFPQRPPIYEAGVRVMRFRYKLGWLAVFL